MKMFSKSLIAISMLSAVSISHASEGFYFGVNLGQASYDVAQGDAAILNDGSLFSADLDDTDTSLSLTLGYQLTPNLSLEGGYIDLGEFAFNATSDGSGFLYPAGPVGIKVETDGLFFDVKGQLPLNEQFSLYGKLGLLKWDTDLKLSLSIGSGSGNVDDGSDVFFGVGGLFNINNNWALNVDYTLYELEDLDVDVFSVGVQFSF